MRNVGNKVCTGAYVFVYSKVLDNSRLPDVFHDGRTLRCSAAAGLSAPPTKTSVVTSTRPLTGTS